MSFYSYLKAEFRVFNECVVVLNDRFKSNHEFNIELFIKAFLKTPQKNMLWHFGIFWIMAVLLQIQKEVKIEGQKYEQKR